jgi:coiled-coil domain-containing protein 130
LAALEKTTDAKNLMEKVQKPRIESLQSVSEHYNADPYSLSLKARKRFREEKKIEQSKRKADDAIKGRYALPTTLSLVEEDEKAIQEAKTQWETAQEEHRLRESKRRKVSGDIITSFRASGSSSSKPPPPNSLSALRTRILQNTAKSSSARSTTSASLNTRRHI